MQTQTLDKCLLKMFTKCLSVYKCAIPGFIPNII